MADKHNNIPENNGAAKPNGFSSKKNIIFIILVTVLTFGIGTVAIVAGVSNSPENRLSRHMRAAERYLSELNYERAVIEYQRVLEIDPMNVDAILGLTDAYIGMGDTEKAIEILRDGLERTGDERIRARLDELTKVEEKPPVSSEPEGASNETEESESEESEQQERESEESEPVFGSMGSVNICGVDIDIATTEELIIYNEARMKQDDRWDFAGYPGILVGLSGDLGAKDMEKIRQLSQLRQLGIMHAGLSEVDALAEILSGLTNLTSLYLVNNEIRDISPLSGLTNLTDLLLYDNEISDISPLSGLTNLTGLDLLGNEISDISPLSGLTNLTQLNLQDNEISDISPLSGLTNLTSLYLYNNEIRDISPLSGLTNLTGLDLLGNEISDISPLSGLTNLTWLNIGLCEISDISPLSGLTNLTQLNLQDNEIRDISPLSGLTNLTDLLLLGNEIRDISPLRNLTNLTNLYLWKNAIGESDIEWLKEKLPNCDIGWW